MVQKASSLRMGYYAITAAEARLRWEKQSGNAIKFTGHKREDIATFFDLLDLDDYVSFGGKAWLSSMSFIVATVNVSAGC